MQTLTEKRVFGTKTGTTEVFVGTDAGLVVVTVSAEQIGTFGLTDREAVTAVAADHEQVVVGGDSGLRYSRLADADRASSPPTFPLTTVETDAFDRLVAVGIGPARILVGDENGDVYAVSIDDDSQQVDFLGSTDGVAAIDGDLVAAGDGVYRVAEEFSHVGLIDVADVAGHGVPLAATSDGLFRLGNGWLAVADGVFRRVASDGHGHASAVDSEGLRTQPDDTTGWHAEELPVDEPIADIAYGSGIRVAITEAGTLCVNAGEGWRHRRLGVPGVTSVAVAGSD